MGIRRFTAVLVLAGLVAACGGGGDSTERTRNVALEVDSAALPFAASNVWPWDIKWSPEAQRAVAYSGDASYEGLFVGQASVVKTSDPNDESVPASFPVSQLGAKTGAPDGKGGWYLGGSYLYMDGQSRGKLVHVLPDGTVDNAFFLDITPDQTRGYDWSAVNWVAMHPNGTDVLVAISGATSVGGVEVENLCNRIYVIDGATGARKVDADPTAELGCTNIHEVVGNRLFTSGGYGEESPLVASVDLTTERTDNYLDALNARYPYFKDSDWDYRIVSEIEVRGDTLWVFGNLDRKDHRVAKFSLATGAPVDFAAPPVVSSAWEPWHWDFAATDSHVMMHVRERDENGGHVSVYHLFDATTGAKTAFDPRISAVSWNWQVRDVTVWNGNFLLTGQFHSAAGRRVRGHVTLDPQGRVAASQLPYAVSSMNYEYIDVREFAAVDRTFVNFVGTNALYDPVLTGMVLVTDKNGVPQEFRLDEDTESRELGGVGVVGTWLYVSSSSPFVEGEPAWTDTRVDRFDLVTGKRDKSFRVDTSGNFVYDIYGDDRNLAFVQMRSDTWTNNVSLRSAADGTETTTVELIASEEVMQPGEAMVDAGRLFIRVVPQQGVTAEILARIDLATGQITYVTGASSSDYMWTRPVKTSRGLMIPMMDRVQVIDPETMTVTGSIKIADATEVAEIGGRLIVNAPSMREVDPETLEVIGPWGPQDFTVTRLVSPGDSAVSGSPQPWRRSSTEVVSGIFGVTSDGTIATVSGYKRLGERAAADSSDVIQVGGPPVQALPMPVGTPQVVPNAPTPNVTTQRESVRVAIMNVAPGDRSATVTFTPAPGVDKHTVRVVGGTQSCTTSTGSCTVKGLTAGTQYRFVVIPDGDSAIVSGESVPVAPWAAMKKGSTKKASSLLKVPAKGTAKWKVTGASCTLKGKNVVAQKKRGMCTLTVSVKTKSGTVRASTNVFVS